MSVLTDVSMSRHAPAERPTSSALADLSLLADDLADPLKFGGHALVGRNDRVERVGDLAGQTCPVAREPDGKVAVVDGLHGTKQLVLVERGRVA